MQTDLDSPVQSMDSAKSSQKEAEGPKLRFSTPTENT